MNVIRRTRFGLFVSLLFLLSCIAVIAAPQVVQRKASLREGPGSFYPVVDQVSRGESITTGESRGSWIKVSNGSNSGWLPKSVFRKQHSGVDYAGLLGSEKSLVISSVDIAAATKGAFEAKYSENKKTDFAKVDILDNLRIDPLQVSSILSTLQLPTRPLLAGLPTRKYKNNIIIQEEAEHLLGRAMAATVVTPGYIGDKELIKYVNAVAAVVGMKSSRYEVPFRVAVIDDESIGGYGIPGGYIVITKGMLREVKSEAELAGLLGHEMAHICLYHGLREFNKRGTHRKSDSAFSELDAASGSGDDPFAELNGLTGETSSIAIENDLNRLANTSYLKIIGQRAREDEIEADLYGAAYAAAAGYDPNALVAYLERIRSNGEIHDAFRHHPSLDDRISELQSGIKRYRLEQRGRQLQKQRFEKETAGMRAATGKVL